LEGKDGGKKSYHEGIVDVFDVEESLLAAAEGYDDDEAAVTGEEQLRQSVSVRIKLACESPTNVATIAASSHPALFVIRNRTHSRSPTVKYASVRRVRTKIHMVRPSINSSSWFELNMLSIMRVQPRTMTMQVIGDVIKKDNALINSLRHPSKAAATRSKPSIPASHT
jgi:hypothetical protein